MASESAAFSSTIYFSYNQFFVFDSSVTLPGCQWTEGHFQQGFARRDKNVCFGTLLEFGQADVSVHFGVYSPSAAHEQVIEVPFQVTSGEVGIEGPEEVGSGRRVKMGVGHYKLVAAQGVDGDGERIDLYFEAVSEPLARSRIVVAGSALQPSSNLIESAETA